MLYETWICFEQMHGYRAAYINTGKKETWTGHKLGAAQSKESDSFAYFFRQGSLLYAVV